MLLKSSEGSGRARSLLDSESEMSGCRHRMCQETESGLHSKADLLPVTVIRILESYQGCACPSTPEDGRPEGFRDHSGSVHCCPLILESTDLLNRMRIGGEIPQLELPDQAWHGHCFLCFWGLKEGDSRSAMFFVSVSNSGRKHCPH